MPSQPRNLRSVREIVRRDILFAVARVPDSDILLVASSDGKVHELNAGENNPTDRELANHGRYVTSVVLARGTAISGGYDGRLIWWNRDRRTLIRASRPIGKSPPRWTWADGDRPSLVRTVAAHARWIRSIAVSPDGMKIASVADDMVVRIWNAATGERLHELRGHAEQTPTGFATMLYNCVFSADGRHLASGDRIGHVIVWDVVSGRQLAAVDAPLLYTWDATQRVRSIGGVRGLAFSPDGKHLAVGGVGQINNVDSLAGPSRVEVFNWAAQERVAEFTGPSGIVNRLIYHPQGDWLCAVGGGGNGLIMFYDTARRAMIHQGNVAMHVHDLVFNEDQTRLYAVGHNKIAVLNLGVS